MYVHWKCGWLKTAKLSLECFTITRYKIGIYVAKVEMLGITLSIQLRKIITMLRKNLKTNTATHTQQEEHVINRYTVHHWLLPGSESVFKNRSHI